MKNVTLAITTAALLSAAGTANAGAKIKINDDATIDLGFRLQTLLITRSGDVKILILLLVKIWCLHHAKI